MAASAAERRQGMAGGRALVDVEDVRPNKTRVKSRSNVSRPEDLAFTHGSSGCQRCYSESKRESNIFALHKVTVFLTQKASSDQQDRVVAGQHTF